MSSSNRTAAAFAKSSLYASHSQKQWKDSNWGQKKLLLKANIFVLENDGYSDVAAMEQRLAKGVSFSLLSWALNVPKQPLFDLDAECLSLGLKYET
jgi:hypothetical protein